VRLQIYSCNKTVAQYWDESALISTRGQTSSGLATRGTLCLDDRHNLTTNRNPIQTYACNLTAAQMVTHVGITLRIDGQCIDVSNAGTASHTLVDLYHCNATVAQVWRVQANGSILNPHSGKCLDVPGGTLVPGVQLQIYTCNATAAQRWLLPG
jgi:hypothetical protein